ncbi:MAG: beta strand repeat-containing protein, partial [Phycisphaerales bacterium]
MSRAEKTMLRFGGRMTMWASMATLMVAMVVPAMAASITNTWNTTTSGNWSNSANWDGAGVPSSTGVADIHFNELASGTVISTIDSAWGTSGSGTINSLNFDGNTAVGGNYTIAGVSAAGSNITIGGGVGSDTPPGIVLTAPRAVTLGTSALPVNVTLGASQTWSNTGSVFAANQPNQGYLNLNGNLSSASGVVLTLSGSSSANGPTYNFASGNSTNFLGSVNLTGAAINLANASQYTRLGSNALTVTPTAVNGATLSLAGRGGFSEVTPTGAVTNAFATPVTFSGFTTTAKNFNVQMSAYFPSYYSNEYSQGQTVDFTGTWSGNIVGGGQSGGLIVFNAFNDMDGRFRFKFSGNNNLTTTDGALNPTTQKGAVNIRSGTVVLNNPNAMGTGNGFTFLVGQINNTPQGAMAGLVATSGNNVAGNILATAGGASFNPTAVLGLDGAGEVTFSGNILAPGTNGAPQNYIPILVLTAPSGGKVNFTGAIQSQNYPTPRTYETPVIVLSGAQGGGNDGTVSLSSLNGYYGKTVVRAGNLLAQGSATNLSTVATSGSVGAGNNTLTLASTSGLLPGVMIGQGVAGIPAGTTIAAINGNQVILSQNLTATVGSGVNLQVGGVFGNGTSAISLGDAVPSVIAVKLATTTDPFGGWMAATGTRTNMPNYVDGVALQVGDRILITESQYDLNRCGVYVVSTVGTGSNGTWVRASDFDQASEVAYGTKVTVTNGTLNAGKSYYVTNQTFPTTGTINTTQIGFNPDASNPNVALLTDGDYTIARNIDVTNNQSTGKSILGGNTADSSTFSGTVTLNRGLTVTAATGGSVDFSGDISGGFNVAKTGTGKVIFSAAKSYSGSTSVTAGILAVNSSLASSGVTVDGGATLQGSGNIANGVVVSGTLAPGNSIGTLTVGSASFSGGTFVVELDGTGSGSSDLLAVTGVLDITNATVDFDELVAVDDPAYVFATYGSLTGIFAPGNIL